LAVKPSAFFAVDCQGGLVFKAHRLWYHSTLGLRVIKKKKPTKREASKPKAFFLKKRDTLAFGALRRGKKMSAVLKRAEWFRLVYFVPDRSCLSQTRKPKAFFLKKGKIGCFEKG